MADLGRHLRNKTPPTRRGISNSRFKIEEGESRFARSLILASIRAVRVPVIPRTQGRRGICFAGFPSG